jgi:hypothetical protein
LRSAARNSLNHLLVVLAVAWALPVAAQWAWKDDNGRLVYSDRPPPANVKPGNIVHQPSRPTATPAPTPTSTPSTTAAASGDTQKTADGTPAAPKSLAEQEMEFRKRQQERADAEKKAQDEQQKAVAKAAECERARGYLKSLDEGIRIARTDASGNREFLDDSQRAAEVQRTRQIVQTTCN